MKEIINKDLSLMKFNERVLHQVTLSKNPIGEKCKFVKIASSNLDEFISVKYGRLMHELNNVDLYNSEDIDTIQISVIKFYMKIQSYFNNKIIKPLSKMYTNINLITDLNKLTFEEFEEGKKDAIFTLNEIFDKRIEHEAPVSGKLYMCIAYKDGEFRIYNYNNFDKLLYVDSKYIPIELLIQETSEDINHAFMFRVIRDSYIDLDKLDNDNLLDSMKDAIREREVAPILAIECQSPDELELVNRYLDSIDDKIVDNPIILSPDKGMCGISCMLNQILEDNDLDYFEDRPSNKIKVGKKHSVMEAVKKHDILLMHPFDDYGTVIRLLEEASTDKDITHIYQTLYRVSSVDSPIVNALCKAADNGKKVTVCIEVKARFNETMNFDIIEKLKSHKNVNLILSNKVIKVHSKAMLIVGKSTSYCHIGTGNYNEKTSELYTDISLLTTDIVMCKDLKKLFKILADKKYKGQFKKIVSEPGVIRETLINNINMCISEVKKGNRPIVTIKVNGIADRIMIDYINYAASLGVNFNIICRGICLLKPTDNIKICSIVGRYLEHSRIYKFDYDSKKIPNKVYISSADLLTRNLERRVEILCKITDTQCKKKINKILKAYNKDTTNKFEYNQDTMEYESYKGEKNVYDVFDKPLFNESIK